MAEKKEKRRFRYLKLLVFLLFVNILIILVVVQVLYGQLVRYEAGMPNTALKEYFAEVTGGNLDRARTDAGFDDRTPEEREVFDVVLTTAYVGKDPEKLSYRSIASNDPDSRRVYAIYQENEKLGEVYMYLLEGQASGTLESVDDFVKTVEAEKPTWRIAAQVVIEYLPPITISALDNATVYVNGKALTGADVISFEEPDMDVFKELPEGYSVTLPRTLTYTADNFMLEPLVTIIDQDGEDVRVEYNELSRHYVAVAPLVKQVEGDERETLAARVTAIARAYALYITNQVALGTLTQYLYPNTVFSGMMWGFDNRWSGGLSSYDFSELDVFSVIKYGDDVLVGDIRFDFNANYYVGGGRTSHSNYTMLFVRSNNQWMLVDLITN